MKRGEVWTAAGGKDYAGKPRPIVIVHAALNYQYPKVVRSTESH